MNQKLEILIAEFLADQSVTFESIETVAIDQSAGTLDISYRNEHGFNFYEMYDPLELLEYLVEKCG